MSVVASLCPPVIPMVVESWCWQTAGHKSTVVTAGTRSGLGHGATTGVCVCRADSQQDNLILRNMNSLAEGMIMVRFSIKNCIK